SSRRRHTRSKRDWSSDVCSSDLLLSDTQFADVVQARHLLQFPSIENQDAYRAMNDQTFRNSSKQHSADMTVYLTIPRDVQRMTRSEERRVGKEWKAACADGNSEE